MGIISQSGALGMALAQGVMRGLSVSHVLTSGNSCDVDMADFVNYLATDPDALSIACVFEGMATPDRLLLAAENARAADKPLVIFKIATGEQGAAAAMSHTGSLAGSHASYRALFRHAGAIVVDDFEALMETAAFFAKAPPPTAPGAAIVAASGGAAIMATDRAEQHGVPMPQPIPESARCWSPAFRSSARRATPATSPRRSSAIRRRWASAPRRRERSAIRRAGVAADLRLRALGEAAGGLQRAGGAVRQDGLRRLADGMAGRAGCGGGEPVQLGGFVPLHERLFRRPGRLALAGGAARGRAAGRCGDAGGCYRPRCRADRRCGRQDADGARGESGAGALRRPGGRASGWCSPPPMRWMPPRRSATRWC